MVSEADTEPENYQWKLFFKKPVLPAEEGNCALSPFWDVLGFQSVSNHTELADHVTDIYHSKFFPFFK